MLRADIVAPSRVASDPAVRRALRGDLDAVLLKALKREPAERYASVQAFVDDIERALRREAVLARPDSWAYRGRQFVRRWPLESGLVAALAIAVPAGAAAQVAVMLALGLGARRPCGRHARRTGRPSARTSRPSAPRRRRCRRRRCRPSWARCWPTTTRSRRWAANAALASC